MSFIEKNEFGPKKKVIEEITVYDIGNNDYIFLGSILSDISSNHIEK